MRKIIVLGSASIVVALLVGGILLYSAYYNSFYAMDRANAFFSRAETAGFAEDMIAYLQQGRELLPTSGNPVWWFPTHMTDFSEIQQDIDGIIARAKLLVGLPRDGAAYQQGMDDLRGKIRTLESQVGEASGFMFVSFGNVLASLVWLTLFVALIYLLKRHSGEREPVISGNNPQQHSQNQGVKDNISKRCLVHALLAINGQRFVSRLSISRLSCQPETTRRI